MNEILLYFAAAMAAGWGAAHPFAMRSVVRGFGDISTNNRQMQERIWDILKS